MVTLGFFPFLSACFNLKSEKSNPLDRFCHLSHLCHCHSHSQFVRVQTGDDLSSRAKFCLITWVGEKVSPLQKARVSTDKAVLKGVVRDFSVEVFANTLAECEEEHIMKMVIKNMGANYGSSSS